MKKNVVDHEDVTSKEALEKVYNIISTVPDQTKETLAQMYTEDFVERFYSSETTWLSFSDTILFAVSFEETESKEANLFLKDRVLGGYLVVAATLFQNLFEAGLPVRGVIDIGQFMLDSEKNFFAGKPIIDAYNLSNRMDLSACCLTKNVSDLLKDCRLKLSKMTKKDIPIKWEDFKKGLLSRNKSIDFLVKEYCFPLKEEGEKGDGYYAALNPFASLKGEPSDLRQYVLDSFWKYNKDIKKSVQSKVDNTEQYFRFFSRISQIKK